MNDLAAFDLNQLQMPNNRWEILIENAETGGQVQTKQPPARTNHTVVTYHDKMYLYVVHLISSKMRRAHANLWQIRRHQRLPMVQ
jgi:hypothetical protein